MTEVYLYCTFWICKLDVGRFRKMVLQLFKKQRNQTTTCKSINYPKGHPRSSSSTKVQKKQSHNSIIQCRYLMRRIDDTEMKASTSDPSSDEWKYPIHCKSSFLVICRIAFITLQTCYSIHTAFIFFLPSATLATANIHSTVYRLFLVWCSVTSRKSLSFRNDSLH